jgi:hypothetical protein
VAVALLNTEGLAGVALKSLKSPPTLAGEEVCKVAEGAGY